MVNNFDYKLESLKSDISFLTKEIKRYKKKIENLESKLHAKPMTDYFELRREAVEWANNNNLLKSDHNPEQYKKIKNKLNWYAREEKRLLDLAMKPIDTVKICNEISSVRLMLEKRNRELYYLEVELDVLKKSMDHV